jgi:hypothetical protein
MREGETDGPAGLERTRADFVISRKPHIGDWSGGRKKTQEEMAFPGISERLPRYFVQAGQAL